MLYHQSQCQIILFTVLITGTLCWIQLGDLGVGKYTIRFYIIHKRWRDKKKYSLIATFISPISWHSFNDQNKKRPLHYFCIRIFNILNYKRRGCPTIIIRIMQKALLLVLLVVLASSAQYFQTSSQRSSQQYSNTINAGTPRSQKTIYYCPQSGPQCQFDFVDSVCATMRDGSVKQIRNNCDACLEGATSYQFKKCPKQTPRSQNTLYYCPQSRPQCQFDFVDSVCATMRDGSVKQIRNNCDACLEGATSYQFKKCPKQTPRSQKTIYCPPFRPQCQYDFKDYVCATMRDGLTKQIRNSCDACLEGATSYQLKKCPKQTPRSQNTIYYCPKSRPQCQYDFADYVCATMRDGSIKQIRNNCDACLEGAVSYQFKKCR